MEKALPTAGTDNQPTSQFISGIKKRLQQDYFAGQPFSVKPFQGTSTHPCFVVESGQSTLFLKWYLDSQVMFNAPDKQHELQQHLAQQQLSVDVTFAPIDHQYVLMPFLQQPSLASLRKLSVRDKTNALAQKLVAIHQLDTDELAVNPLDAPVVFKHYIEQADCLDIADFDHQLTTVETWWNDQLAIQPRTFCHLDLSFHHLINTPQITLIDWEYACACLPLFDLAMAIAINQITPRAQKWLLEDYLMLLGRSNELAKREDELQLYLQLAELCNALWYLAMGDCDDKTKAVAEVILQLEQFTQTVS